jgi:hypothetical protein
MQARRRSDVVAEWRKPELRSTDFETERIFAGDGPMIGDRPDRGPLTCPDAWRRDAARSPVGIWDKVSGVTVVISQHATEALAAPNLTGCAADCVGCLNHPVVEPLVISLRMNPTRPRSCAPPVETVVRIMPDVGDVEREPLVSLHPPYHPSNSRLKSDPSRSIF